MKFSADWFKILALIGFFAALAFDGRLLVGSAIPGFHEYESFAVYLSDFFAVFLIGLNWRRLREVFFLLPRVGRGSLLVFIIFAAVSVFAAASASLALYALARLVLAMLAGLAVAALVRERGALSLIASVFIAIVALEAALGIAQFARQESIGLHFLGESPIAAGDPATSRILIGGAYVVRAYGTFPHPNVFGAFLVLGLIALCALWLRIDWRGAIAAWRADKPYLRIVLKTLGGSVLIACLMSLVAFGLVLTFSRTAWIIGAGAALLLALFHMRTSWRRSLSLMVLLFAASAFAVFPLRAFVAPRAADAVSDRAVTERIAYSRVGFELVKQHPLFGVGIGNQVLVGVQTGAYERAGIANTKPWLIQPAHNIYLLVASEIGMVGGLALLAFFIAALVGCVRTLFRRQHDDYDDDKQGKISRIVVIVMLSSLLLFAFVDHFPWTLVQGQLMLWLTVGLVVGLAKA